MKQSIVSSNIFTTIAFVSALAMSGCGGSSGSGERTTEEGPRYTGVQSAAAITTTNQEDLARTTQEGTARAIVESEGAETDFPLGVTLENTDTLDRVTRLTEELMHLGQLPVGVTIQGDCGGNAQMTSMNAAGTSFRIQYNNYCLEDDGQQTVLNGVADYSTSGNTTTIVYRGVTVTSNGVTETLNLTITCSETSCSISSNYVGSDGRVYRMSNTFVSGDDSSGYSVSARIYNPDHGYVDIEGTGLILCDNGYIGSGTIVVTGSTANEMTIEFSSCFSMTVTHNGVAVTYVYGQ